VTVPRRIGSCRSRWDDSGREDRGVGNLDTDDHTGRQRRLLIYRWPRRDRPALPGTDSKRRPARKVSRSCSTKPGRSSTTAASTPYLTRTTSPSAPGPREEFRAAPLRHTEHFGTPMSGVIRCWTTATRGIDLRPGRRLTNPYFVPQRGGEDAMDIEVLRYRAGQYDRSSPRLPSARSRCAGLPGTNALRSALISAVSTPGNGRAWEPNVGDNCRPRRDCLRGCVFPVLTGAQWLAGRVISERRPTRRTPQPGRPWALHRESVAPVSPSWQPLRPPHSNR